MHRHKKYKKMLFFIIALLLTISLFFNATVAIDINNQSITDVISNAEGYLNKLNLSNLTKKFVIKDKTINDTINSSVKLINGPIVNLTNISINNQSIGDLVNQLNNQTNLSINITVKNQTRSYQQRLRECKLVKKINEEKPQFRYKFEKIAQRFPQLQQLLM